MPKAGVEKLVSLMKAFQAKQSSWGFLLTDNKTETAATEAACWLFVE
jgi:hypothetical protein